MLTELRRALTEVFPEECFLSGLSVKENQRGFSLKPAQGEAAFGIRLDRDAMNWPRQQPRCDALFICSVPDSNALVIVFVELKGGHVEKALEQIVESARALCNKANALRGTHSQPVIDEVRSLGKAGHSSGVLGVIVSKNSLTLDQKERAKILRSDGVVLWLRTGQLSEVTCTQPRIR